MKVPYVCYLIPQALNRIYKTISCWKCNRRNADDVDDGDDVPTVSHCWDRIINTILGVKS